MTKRNLIFTLTSIVFILSGFSQASQDNNDLLLLIPSIVVGANSSQSQLPSKSQFAINTNVVKFKPSDSESAITSAGAASITIGNQTIFIGTRQQSAINQDPILKSFDSTNPANNWTRVYLERSSADGRGVSLLWTGSRLYASFTIDGTQGNSQQDFRRASGSAQQAWLRSYGAGGGANASVVSEINPTNGELLKAVYLTSVLSNGNSNTLLVNNMEINEVGNLAVTADSFFSPRSVSGRALPRRNNGSSPFNYQIELSPDLDTAVSAQSSDY